MASSTTKESAPKIIRISFPFPEVHRLISYTRCTVLRLGAWEDRLVSFFLRRSLNAGIASPVNTWMGDRLGIPGATTEIWSCLHVPSIHGWVTAWEYRVPRPKFGPVCMSAPWMGDRLGIPGDTVGDRPNFVVRPKGSRNSPCSDVSSASYSILK